MLQVLHAVLLECIIGLYENNALINCKGPLACSHFISEVLCVNHL